MGYTEQSKPPTSYNESSKPSTNYTEASKPSMSYGEVINKGGDYNYWENNYTYRDLETATYQILENGG